MEDIIADLIGNGYSVNFIGAAGCGYFADIRAGTGVLAATGCGVTPGEALAHAAGRMAAEARS